MKTSTDKSICVPSLKILGDFWTLRIVDALKIGNLRYCELERKIEGVSTVTLSNRLKKLERAGIINRHEQSRADVVYSLTKIGEKIIPVLDAVNNFSAESKKLQKKN